jgi:hypothetical protein
MKCIRCNDPVRSSLGSVGTLDGVHWVHGRCTLEPLAPVEIAELIRQGRLDLIPEAQRPAIVARAA